MSEEESITPVEETKPTKTGVDYTNPKQRNQHPKKVDGAEKKVEKVIQGDVVVHKRGIGQKFKDLFVAADFRTVLRYVGYDVLIPAARDMIVDSAVKGVERMMYGESSRFRRGVHNTTGSRITYSTPPNRGDRVEYGRDPRTSPPDRSKFPRPNRPDFLVQSKQEAETILDELYNLLNVWDVVSVADLKALAGFPSVHTDQKWGWTSLSGSDVRQMRDGWFVDLPPAEPI